jgi:hypothetical protein
VRQFAFEFAAMVVASTTMVMAVLAAGSSVTPVDSALVLPALPLASRDDTQGCRMGELSGRADHAIRAVAMLCQHESRRLVSFKIEGLAPGMPYTIRLGFMPIAASCDEPPCVPMSLLGESQGGSTELLGEYVTSSSGQLMVTDTRHQADLAADVSSPTMLVQRSTPAGPLTVATIPIP